MPRAAHADRLTHMGMDTQQPGLCRKQGSNQQDTEGSMGPHSQTHMHHTDYHSQLQFAEEGYFVLYKTNVLLYCVFFLRLSLPVWVRVEEPIRTRTTPTLSWPHPNPLHKHGIVTLDPLDLRPHTEQHCPLCSRLVLHPVLSRGRWLFRRVTLPHHVINSLIISTRQSKREIDMEGS